jgi:UDP-glucose 4-epimerase
MIKIVIIGNRSFIAETFIKAILNRKDVSLYCFARNNTSIIHNKQIIFFDLDLNDLSEDLFLHLKDADFVLNFLSNSNYLDLLNDPISDIQKTVIPILSIIEYIAKNNKLCKYFHFGSRLQYKADLNLDESSIRSPEHPYSINKQFLEYYCNFFNKKYCFKYCFLIVSNPFGFYSKKFDKNYSFVNLLLSKALSGDEIEIFGDGSQIRDIIYVDDLAVIIEKLIFSRKNIYGTVNIGSGLTYSIREVAECIIKVVGSGNIVYTEWPKDRKNVETGSYSYDISKLKNILGTFKFHNLEEGLKLVLKK